MALMDVVYDKYHDAAGGKDEELHVRTDQNRSKSVQMIGLEGIWQKQRLEFLLYFWKEPTEKRIANSSR